MVYVVERYLPGLNRSDLLSGLSRLEPMRAGTGAGAEVRYLGSTIVLRDEACFCQFEAPSSDAVAEANRRAGLPFNRIVPAVTVNPKGAQMSAYPSIPATVEIKRGRLFGLVVAVAALTAVVTWVVFSFAFDNGSTSTSSSQGIVASAPSAAQDAQKVPSIMSLTPAQLAAGGFGVGYALPANQTGPTTEEIVAAMSPQTRAHTKAIMNLTFAELAAGAGGMTNAVPKVGTGVSAPSSAAQDARNVRSVTSLTPAELASGAYGTGYALPTAQNSPTTASILASMSPKTRQYTKAIMNLTFAQLAAGAAGHP